MNTYKRLQASIGGYKIEFQFNIASENLLISSYKAVYNYLYDFLIIYNSLLKPDFIVEIRDFQKKDFYNTEQAIYRKIIQKTEARNKIIAFSILDSYDIHLIIKYVIGSLYDRFHSLILHTSAIMVRKKAYIFLGKSGIGKSTVVNILSKKYIPLCDDMAYIRKEKDKYYLYQTPYFEKNKFAHVNKKIEIGKIYILEKFNRSYVSTIDQLEGIYNQIINQILNHPTHNDVFLFLKKYQTNMYILKFNYKDRRIINEI